MDEGGSSGSFQWRAWSAWVWRAWEQRVEENGGEGAVVRCAFCVGCLKRDRGNGRTEQCRRVLVCAVLITYTIPYQEYDPGPASRSARLS